MDERFNGGGSAATGDIIDYMRRPMMNRWATREGEDFSTPANAIFGPKAMIINEMAGSGVRYDAVAVQESSDRPAGWKANVGRARRNLRLSYVVGWGHCHGAESGLLQP